MQISTLQFTEHAVARMCQRNLDEADVDYVLEQGTRFIRTGAIHVFLGKRDVPELDQCYTQVTRLIGTTVLIDSHDAMTVLTVYRNRESIKKDKRKAKFNYRKSNRLSSISQLPLAV